MNKEVEAKIEYQHTIGEASPGSYQPVRFTRVKYKKCDYTHIDIRRYQRAYDENEDEVYYPTKIGFQFPEKEFQRVVNEYTVTPETYLHPKIAKRCLPLLKKETTLDNAVTDAFKVLEMTVRRKIGAPDDEVGLKLLRRAFHPQTGLLTDYTLPAAEREGFTNYIAGAYGYYRNSSSHRDTSIDFLSAFMRVVVASDLLWIVEKAELSA